MTNELNPVSTLNGVSGATSESTGNLEAILIGDVVSNYDEQIKLFSEELQENTAKKSEITSIKTQINEVPASSPGNDPVLGDYHEYTCTDYQQLLALANSVGMGGTLAAGMDSTHANYYVSDDAIADIQGALDEKLADLNSSSDIKMIGFQALMDARKQSLMMLSNMISSDNQTKMAILQNLKN